MKTLNKIYTTGLLAILLLLAAPNKSKAQDGDYISDQEFYDELQPYGTWVSDPQYGNVWIPDAEDDFRPYATRGHWVVTDYGNTWVSDYPWGWATFHYGRWKYDDYYGWEWIPGHEWAPAWVSWRHGGGYYGWAPLLPGISISISIGGGYHVPDNYWVCAPQAYINRPNIYNYYAPPTRSVTIIRNTTIINNTYVNKNVTYVSGPRPQEIQKITHQRVQVYKINNINRPTTINNHITNNTVNIYRPSVRKAPDAHPARVVDGAAYKKQNPNQAIAHRSQAGGPAFNRANATKLVSVAREAKPDNKVVRVNPVANKPNQPNRPLGLPKNHQKGADAQQKQQQTRQAQQKVQQQAAQKQQRAQQAQQKIQQQKEQSQQKLQQQSEQRKVQEQQAQQKMKQQGAQQKEQAQQKQQQLQQTLQQHRQAQQQAQQRLKQEAQQKQQQAQQKQQQAQQAQQRQQAQQQAQQKQQQAQQAQQRQQAQQQAQQKQQQAQQAQQRQQAQQQAQQRQQQEAQQKQQQAQQRQQQAQQKQQQAQQHQQHPQKPQPQKPEPPKQD